MKNLRPAQGASGTVEMRARVTAHREILGRRDERQQLALSLRGARRGRGGAVVIRGEAGIGKSALLDDLALNGEAWCTTPVLNGSVVDVLGACGEHDVEGVVAKRVESPYRPGERSTDWLKLKTAEWRSLHADRRHEH